MCFASTYLSAVVDLISGLGCFVRSFVLIVAAFLSALFDMRLQSSSTGSSGDYESVGPGTGSLFQFCLYPGMTALQKMLLNYSIPGLILAALLLLYVCWAVYGLVQRLRRSSSSTQRIAQSAHVTTRPRTLTPWDAHVLADDDEPVDYDALDHLNTVKRPQRPASLAKGRPRKQACALAKNCLRAMPADRIISIECACG